MEDAREEVGRIGGELLHTLLERRETRVRRQEEQIILKRESCETEVGNEVCIMR